MVGDNKTQEMHLRKYKRPKISALRHAASHSTIKNILPTRVQIPSIKKNKRRTNQIQNLVCQGLSK